MALEVPRYTVVRDKSVEVWRSPGVSTVVRDVIRWKVPSLDTVVSVDLAKVFQGFADIPMVWR